MKDFLNWIVAASALPLRCAAVVLSLCTTPLVLPLPLAWLVMSVSTPVTVAVLFISAASAGERVWNELRELWQKMPPELNYNLKNLSTLGP